MPPAPVTPLRGDGLRRFYRRKGPEPHIGRSRAMLRAHPDLKDLLGPDPRTLALCVAAPAAQVGLALLASSLPVWGIVALAYVVGAWLSHVCWVLIHESTHNLSARSRVANHVAGLLANVPLLIPAYAGFRKFHLLHHRRQGDYRSDADLPSVVEARRFGRSPVAKAAWFLAYPVIQLRRTARLRTHPVLDRLVAGNLAVTLATNVALWFVVGPWGLLYLGVSLFASVGLHPLGARWIQEHYVFRAPQETYSCYSPANVLQLNVGCHVEHHDMPHVAWHRLPEVSRRAPEFYEGLYAHRSWTGLLLTFLFSRRLSLFTRVVADEPASAHASRAAARAASDARAPSDLSAGTLVPEGSALASEGT
jgi:sphingolipid delta-4 desaturase